MLITKGTKKEDPEFYRQQQTGLIVNHLLSVGVYKAPIASHHFFRSPLSATFIGSAGKKDHKNKQRKTKKTRHSCFKKIRGIKLINQSFNLSFLWCL